MNAECKICYALTGKLPFEHSLFVLSERELLAEPSEVEWEGDVTGRGKMPVNSQSG